MAFKLDYMDLFGIAVERMAWAADNSDDPLLRSVAAIRRSATFLNADAWDGGMELLGRAVRDLDEGPDADQAALSVLGTIHLRSAVIARLLDIHRRTPEQLRGMAGRMGLS
jgi:hypothetical protein